MKNRILSTPPGPGLLNRCPKCDAVQALILKERIEDRDYGTVLVYRCQYCGKETEFADRLPRGVI